MVVAERWLSVNNGAIRKTMESIGPDSSLRRPVRVVVFGAPLVSRLKTPN
jgi:hypothetical protein